jgi:hypothetical protein
MTDPTPTDLHPHAHTEYTLSLYLKAMYDPSPNWESIFRNHEAVGCELAILHKRGWRVQSTDGAWIHLVTTDREVALQSLDHAEVLAMENSND